MPGFITNQHDRNNLNFLLSVDQETLKLWYKNCSNDDLLYAKSLLDAFALEIHEEIKTQLIDSQLDKMKHFTEATAVLSYIREKQ